MKRMLLAVAVLAVTGITSFAADVPMSDMKEPTRQMLPQHPEMMSASMPQHLLMMAYHKTFLTFARSLDKVAHHGETVPPAFARTAIAEMRRSIDELEKYRAEVIQKTPAGMSAHGDMHKKMQEHLVEVKIHLRELEALAKSDLIPSPEVIKQLQFIYKGCQGMDHEMTGGKGMHCRGMHRHEMHEGWGRHCCQGQGAMPGNGKMMQDMLQQMKVKDAEMAKQVAEMNRAPQDRKLNLLSNIVTEMAKQHAAMTAHMGKMMQMHMPRQGASMAPGQMMTESDDEDMDCDEEVDIDDMDSDDVQEMN